MADDGSISLWLNQLKDGDEAAVQRLWQDYFHRLVALRGPSSAASGGARRTRRTPP